jgi:hypothetical protein
MKKQFLFSAIIGALLCLPVTMVYGYGLCGYDWTYKSNPMGESYKVNGNCTDSAAGSSSDQINEIQQSMNTWTNCGADFTFTYGGTSTQTTVSANGTNLIYWDNTPPGGGGYVAANYHWISGDNMTESDIVFNDADYIWENGAPASNEMGIQNVGTHELGHTLCLADLYSGGDSAKTMYGYVSYGETYKESLHSDDINGIKAIYGSVPTNSPCELSTGIVNPGGGYYGVRFEFKVHYYDDDGDAPNSILAYVNGTGYAMTLDSGTASNGTYRYRTRDLDIGGSHNYYFYATDPDGSDRLPASGSYSGPVVYAPELYWSGTPAPSAWLTVEVWGCPNALWGAAWSRYNGPFYLPASGLTYDVGPGDLHMAKKIGESPLNLDEWGFAEKDFQLPGGVSSGTKYIQGTTKLNAFWAKTNYSTFVIP